MLRAFLPYPLPCRRWTKTSLQVCSKRAMASSHSQNSSKTLDFFAGPLVWIDCEMTGLNPKKDKILEIAVLITNGNLELVDEGIEYVIKAEKDVLEGMNEWCIKQHGQSGLTDACLKSTHTTASVSHAVLQYIKKWIPEQSIGVLAGNSVHADRAFLVEEMPEVVDWLHYRIVDVSTIKELCRRWDPSRLPPKEEFVDVQHRALDDIRGSLKELQWYRTHLFVEPDKRSRKRKSPVT